MRADIAAQRVAARVEMLQRIERARAERCDDADEGLPSYDGCPTVGDDKLLRRLWDVHHAPRYDLFTVAVDVSRSPSRDVSGDGSG